MDKNILVVDVGGGSTEMIYRRSNEKLHATSFDVGCVRLTEMFLKNDPIDSVELDKLSQYAGGVMNSYGKVNPDLVIAVAGTPTTLACVAQKITFDEKKVEGFKLSKAEIRTICSDLGKLPLSERKKVKGLEPLRADVIIAGGILLNCALNLAGKNELQVSIRGLRYGVALHHDSF